MNPSETRSVPDLMMGRNRFNVKGDSGGPDWQPSSEKRGTRLSRFAVLWLRFRLRRGRLAGRVHAHLKPRSLGPVSAFPDANLSARIRTAEFSVSQELPAAIYSLFVKSKDNIQITTNSSRDDKCRRKMRISVTSNIGGRPLGAGTKGADGTITPIYPNRFIDANATHWSHLGQNCSDSG